jgi:hypothetical protein
MIVAGFGFLGLIPWFTQGFADFSPVTIAMGRHLTATAFAIVLVTIHAIHHGTGKAAMSSIASAATAGGVIVLASLTYQIALSPKMGGKITSSEAIALVAAGCMLSTISASLLGALSSKRPLGLQILFDLTIAVSVIAALLHLKGGDFTSMGVLQAGHVWAFVCGILFSMLSPTLAGARDLHFTTSFAIQMCSGSALLASAGWTAGALGYTDFASIDYAALVVEANTVMRFAFFGVTTMGLAFLLVTIGRQDAVTCSNTFVAISSAGSEAVVTALVGVIVLGETLSANAGIALVSITLACMTHAAVSDALAKHAVGATA